MVIRVVCQILGKYLFYLSIALCFPLLVAAYFQFYAPPDSHPQPHSTYAFVWTLVISLLCSQILRFSGRKASSQLDRREGILIVVLIWFATSLISALPFYFSKTLTHPVDAYFEAMSGLTTTGASMICAKAYDAETDEEIPIHITNPHVPDRTYTYWGTVAPIRDPKTDLVLYSGIEAVSKAILLWRSLLQWLGGMGIVVIFLAVLPILGVGGKFMYQMEMTGPIKDEISPRVRETASQLWKLYLFFTLLEIALLVWTNRHLPFFDALCISFSNISTGGFSVRNDSIASYQSQATETIVLIFMIVGSINFSLYFHAMRFKFFRAYVPDFFLFLAIAAIGSILVSLLLIGHQWTGFEGEANVYSVGEAFRQGSFQALSMQTSTGFATANYDRWPFAAQMFMLLLMFVGGMSGSTAGGIKTSRFYILYKIVLHRLESIYRPDSIRKLRIGSAEVDDKNAQTVLAFFCIAAFFTILGTASLVLDGIDPETSLGLIACFMNNVGLAFRAAGPTDSFAFLSTFSKILATFWMLLGRLEFYVVLLLFLPAFWRNR
jgi:trk system potassium uptake protein TrkH